jgi:hypothetical protein
MRPQQQYPYERCDSQKNNGQRDIPAGHARGSVSFAAHGHNTFL